jgi:hypothetical protein
MPAFKNISLQQFGRLMPSFPIGKCKGGKGTYWACLCSCGNTAVISGGNLRGGSTKSCGCIERERPSHFKHGHRVHGQASAIYTVWVSMIQRCANPHNIRFSHYGGAPVPVLCCDRWLNSFEAFLEDMGERPSPKHSLSRFLDSGHYEPGNVEWGTTTDQAAERRGKRAMLALRTYHQSQLVAA